MKQISRLLQHPLFAGSMIMIIGSNFVNFINLLYHFLMGKLLIPADYGELATLLTLVGLVGMLPFSLGLVIIKFISASKTESDARKIFSWFNKRALLAGISLSGTLIIFSPLISNYLRIENTLLVPLVGLTFLFSIPSFLYRSVLQGLLKFKEMVMTLFAENTLKLILSVVVILLGWGVSGVVGAFLIAIIFGCFYSRIFLKGYQLANDSKDLDINKIIYFTLPVLFSSFSITALYSTDLILVKHYFMPHDAGLYAALSKLGLIIFYAAGPVSAVMFPLISKIQAEGGNYKKIFIYSLILSFLICFGLLLVYWMFPKFIISILYRSLYFETAPLLVWFGVYMIFFTLSSLIINFHLSLGRTKIVILPVLAAIFQLVALLNYHQNLEQVILVNIITTSLLFVSSLVYFFYVDRVDFRHSTSIQTRKNNS